MDVNLIELMIVHCKDELQQASTLLQINFSVNRSTMEQLASTTAKHSNRYIPIIVVATINPITRATTINGTTAVAIIID